MGAQSRFYAALALASLSSIALGTSVNHVFGSPWGTVAVIAVVLVGLLVGRVLVGGAR